MLSSNDFKSIKIGITTDEKILQASSGEVKNSATINYRTQKPEFGGLFCERIFGTTKDFECNCGKYKGEAYRGITCEKCRVRVTNSRVRRDRTGHLNLGVPVVHMWYFDSLMRFVDVWGKQNGAHVSSKDLRDVLYYNAYCVTSFDVAKKVENLAQLTEDFESRLVGLDKELDIKLKEEEARRDDRLSSQTNAASKSVLATIKQQSDLRVKAIKRQYEEVKVSETRIWTFFKDELKAGVLITDFKDFRMLESNYGEFFTTEIGADFLLKVLDEVNVQDAVDVLLEDIAGVQGEKRRRLETQLSTLRRFLISGQDPRNLIFRVMPVIPPDLRPIVQLDGGKYHESDLNALYQRIIVSNNQLKETLETRKINTPFIINPLCRAIQDSVDQLFGTTIDNQQQRTGSQTSRPLKSLRELLVGKNGHAAGMILGKRVDYSGRSVIVVGPELKMHQCGLPKEMALELFKPYVMNRLIHANYAHSPKVAKQFVERQDDVVWDLLEEVIIEHPVLLNRAPTLHRLGIQAYEPVLVEGNAIKLHPLACTAFNADFDGDQMAVHVPLSIEAQAEARVLMLGANNLLKPSDGKMITVPTQDMIIGLYHMTRTEVDTDTVDVKTLRLFASKNEIEMAFDYRDPATNQRDLNLRTPIRYRLENGEIIVTTYGRILFNETLPEGHEFVNYLVGKKELGAILDNLVERGTSTLEIDFTLDRMKDSGFKWSTRSGVTISYADLVDIPAKAGIIEAAEKEVEKVQDEYNMGLSDATERKTKLIDIWTKATSDISAKMQESFSAPQKNTIDTMVQSGARGNWVQVNQIAGLRGLVADLKNNIIARPIKSNYRDGLSVLEYFTATYGGRKGVADTATKTRDSGAFNSHLIEAVHDTIITQFDCGTKTGVEYTINAVAEADTEDKYKNNLIVNKDDAMRSIWGRNLLKDVVDAKGKVIAESGTEISSEIVGKILAAGAEKVTVRTVLTCDVEKGICAKCYGISMATGRLVDVGEAVGVVSAQSIGEPGTQLTMRTFHTGGSAAAKDITQGLPAVINSLKLVKNSSVVDFAHFARHDGEILSVTEDDANKTLQLRYNFESADSTVETLYLPKYIDVIAEIGPVKRGTQITSGLKRIQDVNTFYGNEEAKRELLFQVQDIFISQGVDVYDKNFELLIREIFNFVKIDEAGDTIFINGSYVRFNTFKEENEKAVAANLKPATAITYPGSKPEQNKDISSPVGIVQIPQYSDSWISSMSSAPLRVSLIESSTLGKSDDLKSMNANVIVGRRIPVGTGIYSYAKTKADPTTEALKIFIPSDDGLDDFDFKSTSDGNDDDAMIDDVARKFLGLGGNDNDQAIGDVIRHTEPVL
ncbi:DNA-directed RNA polymerase subunit beta' [Actinomycetota bacterium]|nr:DNA-directed RNA polymerase subunit beta' [Actinomycetota bacterium]